MQNIGYTLENVVAVLVTDTSRRIVWFDRDLCGMFHCNHTQTLGADLGRWLSSVDQGLSPEHVHEHLDRGEGLTVTARIELPTGDQRPVSLTLNPVPQPGGGQPSFVGIGKVSKRRARAKGPSSSTFDQQYQGSSLTMERGRELYARAEALVIGQEQFRDCELSVAKLARRLNTNTQYLSQVINFFSGGRFSTFVNLARLRYADPLLGTGQYDEREIWRECGFGSYSAFYRASHRHRGVSPSRLRESSVLAS